MVEEQTGQGTEPSAPEPTMAQMTAELVRGRTRSLRKLTPVSALAYEGTLLTPEQREQLIAEIAADASCADVRLLQTSAGVLFLYSDAHMTESYARILRRAEEDNPYAVIAGTVREESEVYPRPTPLETFKNPTFGLDPDQVGRYATEMVALSDYSDIKLLTAPTGALYLYSEAHLDEAWAQSLVDWEEVGKYRSL
ncbi:MAG TPA: hypothetical protein VF960_00730 [Chloroflexota bacterium]